MTDDKLARKVKDFYESALSGDRNWRERAKKAQRYYLSQQWNSKDLEVLKAEGRPALTINLILPTINLLTGYQRQNRHDIRVLARTPRAGKLAEVLTALCKHAMDMSRANWQLSAAFLDGLVTGKGWITFDIDYSHDPLNGDLVIEKVNPFDMLEDRESEEYDLNRDAQFVIRQTAWTLEDLKLAYPRKKRLLSASLKDVDQDQTTYPGGQTDDDAAHSTVGGEGSFTDEGTRHKYRGHKVLECWWKERKKLTFLVNRQTGESYKYTPNETASSDQIQAITPLWLAMRQTGEIDQLVDAVAKRYGSLPADLGVLLFQQAPERWKVVERATRVLHRTAMTGDVLLEEREDPFNGLTLFPFIRFSPIAMGDNIMGIVESLMGAQDELNKRSSQALHHTNLSANSGWMGEEEAMSPEQWDDLKDFGSKPGITVRLGSGGIDKVKRIEPVPISQAHMILAQTAADNIKKISGVNVDLLGADPKQQESGRAMMIRQRQGLIANELLFDHWRHTLQLFGEILMELVRSGRNEEASLIYSDAEIQAIVDDANLQVDPSELRSFRTGRYTVKVSQGTNTPTVRQANFEMLLEALRAGVPISWSRVIEASDLPNKDAIMADLVQKEQMERQMIAAGLIAPGGGSTQQPKHPAQTGGKKALKREQGAVPA